MKKGDKCLEKNANHDIIATIIDDNPHPEFNRTEKDDRFRLVEIEFLSDKGIRKTAVLQKCRLVKIF